MTVWGFFACVAGLGIILTNANETVWATGGYSQDHAPLVIASALALAFGSCCIGIAKSEGRTGVFWALILTIVALESWAVLTTGERIVIQRDAAAEPARLLAAQRREAEKRLDNARNAVPTTSARLEAAIKGKATADESVVSEASKKGCASNCRQLLTKAVDDAARELTEARTELDNMRTAAFSKVSAAEAALGALPAPRSETPFADRLMLPGWGLDLIMAMLKSLGTNGVGAALMAFGAHVKRRPKQEVYAPDKNASRAPPPASLATLTPVNTRDVGREADRFAKAMFRPASDARVALADVRTAYHAWCQDQGIDPLGNQEIGGALKSLFSRVGLTFDAGAVVGIEWARPVPAITKTA